MSNHPTKIYCHHGCSECCRGLFDITLLDALYLKKGFDALSDEIKSAIRNKSQARLDMVASDWPLFVRPWMLNNIPESDWDAMMPEEDEAACVFLSEEGSCLVYDFRPMTCRLNGIPLIDVSGEELFDEWCTLNFTDLDPRYLENIRFQFNEVFTQELLLFRELTKRVTGREINELDTIIPAACFLDDDLLIELNGWFN